MKPRYTLDTIYKIYKHGGYLSVIPIEKIYKSLKKHGLQVVLVRAGDRKRLYNYVPEVNKFYLVKDDSIAQ